MLFDAISAQDAECGATAVHVDAIDLPNLENPKNSYGIVVQDDGCGMNRRSLIGMLSFGFSDKEHKAGNVGRFGIGFKSGSMRLAKDALIFTKRDGHAHVAFLSQSFLDDAELDDILIPMFSWRMEKDSAKGKTTYVASEPTNTQKWDDHMAVILRYSFVRTERELLAELDKVVGEHGTRIVLFNLRDPPELDFTCFKDDIRLVGAIPDENQRTARGPVFQQTREGQQATLDVPEDYSLRAYMEILYLRPRCVFTLRGTRVVPRCPIEHLSREYYAFPEYKPRGFTEGISVHIGYADDDGKKCGFHIYNKNRLIRMYQRFGSQLQANTMMKDMLGVVEAEALEPTHNKQAFKEVDITYQKFKRYIVQCMNDYYFGIQKFRMAGGGGRGKQSTRGARAGENAAKRRKILRKAARRDSTDASDEESDEEQEITAATARKERAQRVSVRGRPRGRLVTRVSRIKVIHRQLMVHKNAYIFLKPVDPVYWEIPDYFDVIKNPMDLGTINERLERDDYYTEENYQKYAADVRLVWSNAMTYNKEDDVVYKMARIMSREFEYHWQQKIVDADFTYAPVKEIGEGDDMTIDSHANEGDDAINEPTRSDAVAAANDAGAPSPTVAPQMLVNTTPAVLEEGSRIVRVPKALSTLLDETFFKTLEESYVQLEKELAEERKANERYVDENIKPGPSGTATITAEQLMAFKAELARLRERVETREKELEVERAKVRKLEDENQRLTAEHAINLGKPMPKAPWSTVVTDKIVVAAETKKFVAYVQKRVHESVDVHADGWRVQIFVRKNGKLAGSTYKEFISPEGVRMRSMKEVVGTYYARAPYAKIPVDALPPLSTATMTEEAAEEPPKTESDATREGTPENAPAMDACASPQGLDACRREDLTSPSELREVAVATDGPALDDYEPLSDFLRKQQPPTTPSDAPA